MFKLDFPPFLIGDVVGPEVVQVITCLPAKYHQERVLELCAVVGASPRRGLVLLAIHLPPVQCREFQEIDTAKPLLIGASAAVENQLVVDLIVEKGGVGAGLRNAATRVKLVPCPVQV